MTTNNSTSIERYWLCPLYLFDSDSECADFVEGIQIKLAPQKLKEHIHVQTVHLYGQWSDPSNFKWAVFIPNRAENIQDGERIATFARGFKEIDRVKAFIFNLITALKIFKKGRLTIGPVISASLSDGNWSIGGTEIWTNISQRDFQDDKPHYLLKQSDIPIIKGLLSKLISLREQGKLKNLEIAINRLHSSHYGDIRNRMVDQMIAFESLFLGNEPELAYRLALRTTFILRTRKDQRSILFSDIRKAYGYRSRIVHGDNPPSKNEVGIIVPKIEGYLRESINKFLTLIYSGMSFSEIRNQLDENILTNSKLLASRD